MHKISGRNKPKCFSDYTKYKQTELLKSSYMLLQETPLKVKNMEKWKVKRQEKYTRQILAERKLIQPS